MGAVPNTLIQLVNEHAVAEMFGVSLATVRRWRLLRTGPKFRKIGSAVRYKPEDLEAFLESTPTGGGQSKEDAR